jgi:hypothetical protein
MAGSVASLLIDIAANTSSLKVGLDKARGEIGSFRGSIEKAMGDVGKSIVTAALGFASFETAKHVFVDMIHEMAEAEKATLKLEAVLKATGYSAGLNAKQIETFARQLSEHSLFSHVEIENAAAELVSFRNISGKVFQEIIKDATDLSVVMGEDLNSSVLKLAKALNDPIQGLTSLRRIGVSFTATQKAQIEQFVKANNVMGAQKIILQELQDRFGGAGETAAGGLAGALVQTKNAWHDFLEEVGKTGDVVGEQQGYFARFFSGLAEIIRKLTPENNPMQLLGKQILDLKRDIAADEQSMKLMAAAGIPTQQVENHLSILRSELLKLQGDAKKATAEAFGKPTPSKPRSLGPTDEEEKAIDAVLKKLKEEAETYGMTDIQRQRWILTTNHATKAELALFDARAKLLALREREQKILGGSLGVMRDLTREGATAEQQAAMLAATMKTGVSDAMRGVGGERGKSPYRELLDKTKTTAEEWRDAWRSAIAASTQAFANFFQTAFTEGQKLRDFLKGLLASVANVFATMASTQISKGIGHALGLDAVHTYHAGGLVGAGGAMRQVPALAFAGAPRMHGGGWLAPDEVPAILQRGERVLSRADAANGGGGSVVNVYQNVSFPIYAMDGPSVQQLLDRHAGHIAGIVGRAAREAPGYARGIVANGMRR